MLEVGFSGKASKKQSGVRTEKRGLVLALRGRRRGQTHKVIAWEKSSSLGQDEPWGDALALEACTPARQSLPGPEKEQKEGPGGVFPTRNTPSPAVACHQRRQLDEAMALPLLWQYAGGSEKSWGRAGRRCGIRPAARAAPGTQEHGCAGAMPCCGEGSPAPSCSPAGAIGLGLFKRER